jgi:hypothetical protein
MFEHKIMPTDPRFLDFTFIGVDKNNYKVKFSDFDKMFILSANQEKVSEGTAIIIAYPNRFVLYDGSTSVADIFAQELNIITQWEWHKHVKGKTIIISVDNALKAKQKMTP